MLFGSLLHEDCSITDLLTADYTFVDACWRSTTEFRRGRAAPGASRSRTAIVVAYCASILTVTSYANRTSPVVRK